VSHYFEDGVFNRRGAWHGLGSVWQPTDEQPILTPLIALELSGLKGWDVFKEPIKRNGKDTGKFWTVRTTDDQEFGVVGRHYEVIQNEQGFEYLDHLIDAGDIEIETAISIYGGKVVTILARKPEGIQIGEDAFDRFIGFTNRHDGLGACKVFTCYERIVCANTQRVAELEFEGSGRHFSIRHQGDTVLKLAQAREALELSFKEDEAFKAAMENLMNERIDTQSYSRDMANIVGLPKIDKVKNPRAYRNARNTALAINDIRKNTPDLQNHSNDKYGVFQSVTQYETRNKKFRNDGTKFQKLAVEGGELTNAAFAVLTQ
jgi:phage/plasmid-like protein (TIGR03299 family)